MAAFTVQPVRTPAEQEQFLDVPTHVYGGDPNWVPPLRRSVAKVFLPSNPFRDYGQLQQFIALTSNSPRQPLGRVVAAVNRRLIAKEGNNVGLFGFFECVQDLDVARAIMGAACQWLQAQGMTTVRGPIDLSIHNGGLFLVEGFDTPPMVMTPYNPPYYGEFMLALGWHRAKDAYAYDLPLDKLLAPKFERAYRIAQTSGIQFRSLQTKGAAFEADCRGLYHLFTTAFNDNWSASPLTEAEFLGQAQDLKTLVDPDIFLIAEDRGKMVGFFMGLPDYNLALKHVHGRLNWLGVLKFLWYRRQIDQGRVLAIGLLPAYRGRMIAPALGYLGMKGGVINKKRPYKRAELSWVWEDNLNSRKIIEASGATILKTYRAYEKDL